MTLGKTPLITPWYLIVAQIPEVLYRPDDGITRANISRVPLPPISGTYWHYSGFRLSLGIYHWKNEKWHFWHFPDVRLEAVLGPCRYNVSAKTGHTSSFDSRVN
jgi:hypothetical protein